MLIQTVTSCLADCARAENVPPLNAGRFGAERKHSAKSAASSSLQRLISHLRRSSAWFPLAYRCRVVCRRKYHCHRVRVNKKRRRMRAKEILPSSVARWPAILARSRWAFGLSRVVRPDRRGIARTSPRRPSHIFCIFFFPCRSRNLYGSGRQRIVRVR